MYSVGQLVYLYKPTISSLTANSKKIAAEWCGPLVVHDVLDRTHYILATLKGEILRDVFNFNRLKPCFVRASGDTKNITHIQKLKEALGKNNDQPKPEALHFIDENDEGVPVFDNVQVLNSGQVEPIDPKVYNQ